MNNTNNDDNNKAKYITDNINNLSINERQEILQILVNSVDDNKIQTKGDGTQIKLKDIPQQAIVNIYGFMHKKLSDKVNKLKYFSDSDTEEEK